MTEEEMYLFDLNGYLIVRGAIAPNILQQVNIVVDALERHVHQSIDEPPHKIGHYGLKYHLDKDFRYASNRYGDGGPGFIVEDIINCDPAFDCFIGEETVCRYVNEMILGSQVIASTQIFFRYKGNFTPTHMGGLIDARNRYTYLGRRVTDTETGECNVRHFDLNVVRVLYALHDIDLDDGPLCVVPGSHKANLHSPYSALHPEREPMMIGLPMQAGDVLIFTENLRHGGLPIKSSKVRKTVHLTYQPRWTLSMSALHWNDNIMLPEDVRARLGGKARYFI